MRKAGILGFLHSGDARVRPGVVEDDGLGAAGNRGIDQFRLLVGVVVVDKHDRVIAELLRSCRGAIGLGLEERIVVRGRDDRHEICRPGDAGGAENSGDSGRAEESE